MRLFLMILMRLIVFLLLIMGLGVALITTEAGTRATVKVLLSMVPGTIKVGQIEGKIISNLTLRHLLYQHQQNSAKVDYLHVSWDAHKLWQQQVHLTQLIIANAQIHWTQTKKNTRIQQKKAVSFDLADVLKHIWVDSITIDRLRIEQNNAPALVLHKLAFVPIRPNNYTLLASSNLGQFQGSLFIDISDTLQWRVLINSRQVNLTDFFPDYPSQIGFDIASEGTWETAHRATFQLSNITGEVRGQPLVGRAEVQYTQHQLWVKALKLTLARADFTMAGKVGQQWDLRWQLSVPQLGALIPQASGGLFSSGKLTGPFKSPYIDAVLKGSQLNWNTFHVQQLEATLDSPALSQVKVSMKAVDAILSGYALPYLKGSVALQLEKPQVTSTFAFEASALNKMEGQLKFNSFDFVEDQPIEGRVTFQLDDLTSLVAVPQIKKLKGQLRGSLKLAGRLPQPTVAITLNLVDGHFFVPQLGATFEEVTFNAYTNNTSSIQLAGGFKLGEGKAQLSGRLGLSEKWALTLSLIGQDLKVADLPEYQVTVSPNLTLENKDDFSISGHITIPTASIAPKDLSGTVTLPNDVVIVSSEEKADQSPLNKLKLNVQLLLGDNIHIDYDHLNADLKGQLLITQSPGSLPVASGQLYTKNGTYAAYGKMLVIKEGRLIYAGHLLMNPGLDIRAVREIEKVAFAQSSSSFNQQAAVPVGTESLTVGVLVSGDADKPQVSLFSDPAGLSYNDILSYLIFGYPQSGISAEGQAFLIEQLSANLTGGSKDKVQKALGLSELNVGSTEVFNPNDATTTSATTLNVGKKVGKKLYLRYSVGLTDSVQIISMKYQLSKYFSLKSEQTNFNNNSDSGADILYEFESN